MMKLSGKAKNQIRSYFWAIVLAIDCLLIIALYLWAAITSFKSQLDLLDNVIGLPADKFGWRWDNYVKAFEVFYVPVSTPYGPQQIELIELFFNTIAYAGGCAFVITFSHFVCAYITARYQMAICKVVFNIVILTMVIPIYGSLPAELKMVRSLGLYDSIWGQYLLKISFLGTYFLIFNSSIKSLGNAYAEAAEIDGASPSRVMFSIYLPLDKSVFIGIFLLYFIGYWNEYMTPLYYMPSYPTINYALNFIQYANATEITTPIILGTAMLSALPVVILFIFFRDKFMGNLTFGGLKG